MAITKTLIQKTNARATVKVTATAANDTTTINLATELNVTGETVTTPVVNIAKIWYSVSSAGSVTITRNGIVVAKLFGHDTMDGFALNEQNTHNIVVTFDTSAGGTVILELGKTSGYFLPDSLANRG
jgi:antitoxin (DNA-binding transcriptional repressor) of toxin-antitoxin stability system